MVQSPPLTKQAGINKLASSVPTWSCKRAEAEPRPSRSLREASRSRLCALLFCSVTSACPVTQGAGNSWSAWQLVTPCTQEGMSLSTGALLSQKPCWKVETQPYPGICPATPSLPSASSVQQLGRKEASEICKYNCASMVLSRDQVWKSCYTKTSVAA